MLELQIYHSRVHSLTAMFRTEAALRNYLVELDRLVANGILRLEKVQTLRIHKLDDSDRVRSYMILKARGGSFAAKYASGTWEAR